MKDRIIDESIKSLQTEGLRFSVDLLAEKLKVSKKTIYKYFPTKEALALSMYEKYYNEANKKMQALLSGSKGNILLDLLYVYYDSKRMIRNEIFNKYQLNDVIRSYAAEQINLLWTTISSVFQEELSEAEIDAVRMIVDGAMEKLCDTQDSPKLVIERLVKLI